MSLSPIGLFTTPVDCSPPGSSVYGILQLRVLEWENRALKSIQIALFPSEKSHFPSDFFFFFFKFYCKSDQLADIAMKDKEGPAFLELIVLFEEDKL